MACRPFHNLAGGGARRVLPRGPLRPARQGTDRSCCFRELGGMPRKQFILREGKRLTDVGCRQGNHQSKVAVALRNSGRRSGSKVRVEAFSPEANKSHSPVTPTPASKKVGYVHHRMPSMAYRRTQLIR